MSCNLRAQERGLNTTSHKMRQLICAGLCYGGMAIVILQRHPNTLGTSTPYQFKWGHACSFFCCRSVTTGKTNANFSDALTLSQSEGGADNATTQARSHLRKSSGYASVLVWGCNSCKGTTEDVMQQTLFVKGMLILKCLFGVFNFLQKTNENKST